MESVRSLADVAAEVDDGLRALPLPDSPSDLYEPVRYVLSGGGKRIRPAIVLLTADALGGADARRRSLSAALGVEAFHNFTLVHDDIMDRSPTRRGRPTVHEKWDTATAILTGDLMMGLANDLVVRSEGANPEQMQRAFYTAVARLCEGQTLDMSFERRRDVTEEEYIAMIDGKTGALLELSLEVGARISGADDGMVETLRGAGRALGRAFQIQDDLLDLTADAETWGKPIGGDLIEGKRTYLVVTALARAEPADRRWLDATLSGGISEDLVPEVRERLRTLGVLALAADAVAHHTSLAERALSSLPEAPPAEALRSLARQLATRSL
ncbi:MAG: polyprenyl synthetase family protein [Bacteroidota bacterium]